ncbi:unnamed protein product [Heterobilharzia americana]|nr:unnamed protein product [Heterobilharzia americana]
MIMDHNNGSHQNCYLWTNTAVIAIVLFILTLIFRSIIILSNYSSTTVNNHQTPKLPYVNIMPGNVTLPQNCLFHNNIPQQLVTTSMPKDKHRIPVKSSFTTGSDDLKYPLEIDMLKLVKQILSNISAPYNPINDPQFSMLITESQKCEDIVLKTGEPLELLILIKSAPSNFLRRDAIRSTWGNNLCWGGRRVIHLFLFGNVPPNDTHSRDILKNESNVYGDIIQQDFLDHYYNNTYKIMFGIDWAVKYCSNVPIIMFVDDDYFVYPQNVVAYIEGLSEELRDVLISGYVWYNAVPIRKKSGIRSKWLIDWDEYPHKGYPPYVAAGNFFLSMNLARKLNVAIRYTKYLRFDDVYLGIILKKLLYVPIHLKEVYTFYPVNITSSQVHQMISSHNFGNPVSQFFLWKRLNCSQFCVQSLV